MLRKPPKPPPGYVLMPYMLLLTPSPAIASPRTVTPFATHIDHPMPRALREHAATKTFDEFVDEYASTAGPVRLGQWSCDDEKRLLQVINDHKCDARLSQQGQNCSAGGKNHLNFYF